MTGIHPILAATQSFGWITVDRNTLVFAGLALAIAGICSWLVVACRHLGVRLNPARRWTDLIADQRGTAMVEFALVLPVLMFFVMLLAQTVFVMTGHMFVNYAAFAAARSAIVVIPSGSPTNLFEVNSDKHRLIERAAICAVLPAAGHADTAVGNLVNPDQYVENFKNFYTEYNQTPPAWIDKQIPTRLNYAINNTETNLYSIQVTRADDQPSQCRWIRVEDSHNFGPHDPVGVVVEHKLVLSLPYVSAIFADGQLDSGQTRYARVIAEYILPNEGVSPEMPPQPEVPRRDP